MTSDIVDEIAKYAYQYFKWGFLRFIRYSLLFYSKTALKKTQKL